jgi:transcriptional regulator with XRE-family HTH domain
MKSLSDVRREAGYTIDAAAEKLNIPMGYLSHIENGKRSVSPERARAIANLYGKELTEIFLPSRYSVREVI